MSNLTQENCQSNSEIIHSFSNKQRDYFLKKVYEGIYTRHMRRCLVSKLKYAKYAVLDYILDGGELSFFSNEAAAKALGMSKSTFLKHRDELLEIGVIKYKKGNCFKQANQYFVQYEKMVDLILEGQEIHMKIYGKSNKNLQAENELDQYKRRPRKGTKEDRVRVQKKTSKDLLQRSSPKISLSNDADAFVDNLNLTDSAKNKERVAFKELVKIGHGESDIIEAAEYLLANGTPKGEKVDRPFAYLASGAIDKTLSRARGERSDNEFDSKKIFDCITKYNTKAPLPVEVICSMSKKELNWLEDRGGRSVIGQWSEVRLRRELRI